MHSIHQLGHLGDFMRRAAQLNRLHNPEAPELLGDQHTAPGQARTTGGPPVRPAGQEEAGAEGRTARARMALTAIHRSFPSGAPVHEQAAYLLRGFAGLQPFAAGSDLAGWDLVAETLEHHGYDLLAESEDGRALAAQLWTRLSDGGSEGVPLDRIAGRDEATAWLAERDEALRWLADWFRARIVDTGIRADIPR